MNRTQFSASVIKRFMSSSSYEEFVRNYESHKAQAGGLSQRTVNEKDLAILADYKSGTTKIKDLSEKHMVTPSAVLTSLRIAALSKI